MASNLTAAPRGLRLRTTRQLHCQRPIYALRSLELRVARSPVWWYSPVPLFCALFRLAPSSANASSYWTAPGSTVQIRISRIGLCRNLPSEASIATIYPIPDVPFTRHLMTTIASGEPE
jgi:hypothetical protein